MQRLVAGLGAAAILRLCRCQGQPDDCDNELRQVIGDVDLFIDGLHNRLCAAGLNPQEHRFEMDHVCYRVDTIQKYRDTLSALVPRLGELLVEGMIGGCCIQRSPSLLSTTVIGTFLFPPRACRVAAATDPTTIQLRSLFVRYCALCHGFRFCSCFFRCVH